MERVRKALVVGGGIGGMTLATALMHAGISAEIVELTPTWSVYGIGISIQGATLRALRQIGVLDQIISAGFVYSELMACDVNGRVTGRIELPPLLGAGNPECIGIMRPILQDVLRGALQAAGVRVRLGVSVASMIEDALGVDVRFTDGSNDRFDVVIGADGIGSSVRQTHFLSPAGQPFQAEPTGQAVWRAMVPRPEAIRARTLFYGPRNKAGCNPVSPEEMYIFLVQTIERQGHLPDDELPAMMRELLADFGGPIAQVRDQIQDPSRIAYRPISSFLMPLPWHRGRIVLIGDAVHCPTPQMASGAGLAIEDSIVLAELLAAGGPLEQSLVQFGERRFERCKMVIEASRQVSEWEKTPGLPGADPVRVLARANAALAAPI